MPTTLELPLALPPVPAKPYSAAEFRVLRLRELPLDSPLCDEPQRVYDFWQAHVAQAAWYNPDAECLVAVLLNTRRRIQGFAMVSIGTLDTILVHSREVLRAALVKPPPRIVLGPHQPTGGAPTSAAAQPGTPPLIRGGQLLRIEVADHVIIGRPLPGVAQPYVSLRQLGYFYAG